jgi:hypothetical protein
VGGLVVDAYIAVVVVVVSYLRTRFAIAVDDVVDGEDLSLMLLSLMLLVLLMF